MGSAAQCGMQKAMTARLCRLLGVSRSGDYAAQYRLRRPLKVCPLRVTLKALFMAHGCALAAVVCRPRSRPKAFA